MALGVAYLNLQHLEPRGAALEGVALGQSIRLAGLPVDGGYFLRDENEAVTKGRHITE